MPTSRTRGFSLVELMITIAVVAVLASIAWPNFRDMLHRNAVTSQINQVVASLQYARNEAVSRRDPTGMCEGTGPASASTALGTCDGSNTLEDGWLVWRDSTLSGAPTLGTGDELLRAIETQPNISIRMFKAATALDQVAFDQRGQVIGAGSDITSIVVCAKNQPSDTLGVNTQHVPGQAIQITPSGRITVRKLAGSDACDAPPA